MPRRLLILEHQIVIALDIAERVRALGWLVAGPFNTSAGALEFLETGRVDAGLIDLSARPECASAPVAEAMARAGMPFIFTNSHGGRFALDFPDAPRLEKPYGDEDFLDAVRVLEDRLTLRPASAPPAADPA
ncbi:MAG: hypothetical protein ABL308_06440 [Oceanicaulis sp.]